MTRSPVVLRLGWLALASLSTAACGSPPPPLQAGDAPPPSAAADTSAAPVAAAVGDGTAQAHALVIQAASCWFGGLWSDAEGAADSRRAAAEKRCLGLVQRLYGSDDKVKYDQLRLVDPRVVDKLAADVDKLAAADPVDGPRKDALGRLLRALAAAQRENNDAHIAADTVKADLKAHEPETLSRDEVAAVGPLRAHAGLEALLKLDAGDLGGEAHALGLLTAMDRMELARGLPKHLKVYAVGDAYQLVFGVAPPSVPADATAKLVPGAWLTYLVDVARAAGHAVPAAATSAREREPWAWGGVIAGFGDKLKSDAPRLSGPFAKVAAVVVKRLDAEWAEIPEIAGRQKAMGDREASEKGKPKDGDKPKK
jgi:hypothetical protein